MPKSLAIKGGGRRLHSTSFYSACSCTRSSLNLTCRVARRGTPSSCARADAGFADSGDGRSWVANQRRAGVDLKIRVAVRRPPNVVARQHSRRRTLRRTRPDRLPGPGCLQSPIRDDEACRSRLRQMSSRPSAAAAKSPPRGFRDKCWWRRNPFLMLEFEPTFQTDAIVATTTAIAVGRPHGYFACEPVQRGRDLLAS